MPVDTPHKEYSKRQTQWQRCRHVIEGSDAVKEQGVKYLPQLSGMDNDEYDGYRQRAMFYGATGRTVQGLLGAIFRRDPVVEYPKRFQPQLEDLTVDGLDHVELGRRTIEEVLGLGRLGILVDVATTGATRAYASVYAAENIVSWRTTNVDGRETLSRVVLQESIEVPDANDPFATEDVKQYRVLEMLEGVYTQTLYRDMTTDKGQMLVEHDRFEPTRLGLKLDFIPFQPINAFTLTVQPAKPPLLDLVDVNLSHYRTSADLEHGAHFTALPTAVLAGFSAKDGPFKIGSGIAWTSTDPQAKAFFLEYTGKGLDSLRDLKRDKESLMAVLGARMLEEQKRAAEAADTKRLNRAGEEGSLLTIAATASAALTNVLRWLAWWSGNAKPGDPNIVYRLNTDFMDTQMTPQELTALISARQANEISQETFLYNLKRGELLPPQRTVEEEKDLIETEEPI